MVHGVRDVMDVVQGMAALVSFATCRRGPPAFSDAHVYRGQADRMGGCVEMLSSGLRDEPAFGR